MAEKTFDKHDSKALCELYQGYQLQKPENAEVIFIGLDANWPVDIDHEANKLFFQNEIVPYLKDGIGWIKKYRKETYHLEPPGNQIGFVHHPLLLRNSPYHKNFAELELYDYLDRISFAELLCYPTKGQSTSNLTLYKKYLFDDNDDRQASHLKNIDTVLFKQKDKRKLVFIPKRLFNNGLLKNLHERNLFMPIKPQTDLNGPDFFCVYHENETYIITCNHLSCLFQKPEDKKLFLSAMSNIVKLYLQGKDILPLLIMR